MVLFYSVFEVKETEKEVTILILSIDRMIAKDILHSSIIKNECTRMLKKAKYIFISQECYIILLPFICK